MAASRAFISSNLLFKSWFVAPLPMPLAPKLLPSGCDALGTTVARPLFSVGTYSCCVLAPTSLLAEGWPSAILVDLKSFHLFERLLFIALNELPRFCPGGLSPLPLVALITDCFEADGVTEDFSFSLFCSYYSFSTDDLRCWNFSRIELSLFWYALILSFDDPPWFWLPVPPPMPEVAGLLN